MHNATGALASLIAISAAVVAYYWFVVAKLGRMSRPLVYVTALRRRYPTRESAPRSICHLPGWRNSRSAS